MLFGWSFPKLMIVLSVGFLLFGVPLMAWTAGRVKRNRDGMPR